MNHKTLIILILIITIGVYLFVDENKQSNEPPEVVSVHNTGSQLFIDFLDFVENEQMLFEREFDISQRSVINFIGEKEKAEIISSNTEVMNTGGICFESGFQDGAKDFEDIGFILINPDTWNTLSYENKKILIYHELTHCSLSFSAHVESNAVKVTTVNKIPTYSVGNREVACPVSILITSLFSIEQESCFRDNVKYYLEDIHIRTGR